MKICPTCTLQSGDSASECVGCGHRYSVAPPLPAPPGTKAQGGPFQYDFSGGGYVKDGGVARGRQPVVAALLSFVVCGLGQAYNGQVAKGGLALAVCLAFAVLFFPVAAVVLLLAIVDAYLVCARTARGETVDPWQCL